MHGLTSEHTIKRHKHWPDPAWYIPATHNVQSTSATRPRPVWYLPGAHHVQLIRPVSTIKGYLKVSKAVLVYTVQGLSFVWNRQRRKEGTYCASESAEIKYTSPAPQEQGMPALINSATGVHGKPSISKFYLLWYSYQQLLRNYQVYFELRWHRRCFLEIHDQPADSISTHTHVRPEFQGHSS
jgi:hypothetical protein